MVMTGKLQVSINVLVVNLSEGCIPLGVVGVVGGDVGGVGGEGFVVGEEVWVGGVDGPGAEGGGDEDCEHGDGEDDVAGGEAHCEGDRSDCGLYCGFGQVGDHAEESLFEVEAGLDETDEHSGHADYQHENYYCDCRESGCGGKFYVDGGSDQYEEKNLCSNP